jgi:hypothetical protein
MIADNLTTEPNYGQTLGRQNVLLGDGHLVGLAGDKFYPAGGAAGIAATGMQLIDVCFVAQGKHKALACGHLEISNSLDRQLGHGAFPPHCERPRNQLTV